MASSPHTQSKRRHLFGALLGAILIPALVAVLLPNGGGQETIVATAPVSAAPVSSSPPTSVSTTTSTVAPTTEAPTTTEPVTTTTVVKTTTTTAAPTTTTTAAPKPVAVYVAPPTTEAPQYVAPPPPPSGDAATMAFLACVRQRESRGNYSVVSSNGLWHGAYQFAISSWNSTASHAGRGDLVGVLPSQASPADQDAMALHLYHWQGKAPWGGYC